MHNDPKEHTMLMHVGLTHGVCPAGILPGISHPWQWCACPCHAQTRRQTRPHTCRGTFSAGWHARLCCGRAICQSDSSGARTCRECLLQCRCQTPSPPSHEARLLLSVPQTCRSRPPELRNYGFHCVIYGSMDSQIRSMEAFHENTAVTEDICRSKSIKANRTLCRHRRPSFPISARFQETGHMDGCCLQATAVDRLACAWVHLYLCPLAWAPGGASAPLAYSCRYSTRLNSLPELEDSDVYNSKTFPCHCGRPNRPIPARLPDQGPPFRTVQCQVQSLLCSPIIS